MVDCWVKWRFKKSLRQTYFQIRSVDSGHQTPVKCHWSLSCWLISRFTDMSSSSKRRMPSFYIGKRIYNIHYFLICTSAVRVYPVQQTYIVCDCWAWLLMQYSRGTSRRQQKRIQIAWTVSKYNDDRLQRSCLFSPVTVLLIDSGKFKKWRIMLT